MAVLDYVSERAVDGAMARLHEVRNNGGITGEAWTGSITDAWHSLVRGSLQ